MSASTGEKSSRSANILPDSSVSRRDLVKTTSVAAAALSAAGALGGSTQPAAAASNFAWEQVTGIPMGATLYDVDFDSKDPEHGWIVGSKGTFLETTDGGRSWVPRSFVDLDPDEEVTYRFERVSFNNGEGWIIGKPPILLHTQDSGKSWERIPLSPKLPGEPSTVFATGPNSAEMTTSTGAIYKTTNAGRNWKAQVKETIDATLNRISSSGVKGASYFTGSIISVVRDQLSGAYLAVSSRGNFFLTWLPGQDFWVPHNRGTSRRIQNMGFVKGDTSKGVWMSLNGGLLQICEPNQDLSSEEEFKFADSKIRSGGYGILDVSWKDEQEVWAVGGAAPCSCPRTGARPSPSTKVRTRSQATCIRSSFSATKDLSSGQRGSSCGTKVLPESRIGGGKADGDAAVSAGARNVPGS
jgi:photosystem II stability/assembly factor-like uncharacterized protein